MSNGGDPATLTPPAASRNDGCALASTALPRSSVRTGAAVAEGDHSRRLAGLAAQAQQRVVKRFVRRVLTNTEAVTAYAIVLRLTCWKVVTISGSFRNSLAIKM